MHKYNKTALLLALALLVGFSAYAQQFTPESDFESEYIEGGRAISITGYTGTRTVVNIPPQIQGLPVTSIGYRAFEYTQITSVTIPNSVTEIGAWAFSDTSLTSVTIPNNVVSIGAWAFQNTGLTSVVIPNSVTYIGRVAFGNTNITSVTIPESVTSIENRAFYSSSLTVIQVAPGNHYFSSVDGILYDKAQRRLIQYPGGRTGAFIIPNSVTSIGNSAFSGTSLTSISIPNSVT